MRTEHISILPLMEMLRHKWFNSKCNPNVRTGSVPPVRTLGTLKLDMNRRPLTVIMLNRNNISEYVRNWVVVYWGREDRVDRSVWNFLTYRHMCARNMSKLENGSITHLRNYSHCKFNDMPEHAIFFSSDTITNARPIQLRLLTHISLWLMCLYRLVIRSSQMRWMRMSF